MTPAATLTHDPDHPGGCVVCPLFRDGSTCTVVGQLTRHEIVDRRERLVAPPECPLRRGDVVVRRPR